MKRSLSILWALLALASAALPQAPETRLNPAVKQIVDAISEQRIAAISQKLEGFGTRYVLSAQDDPLHGIGAAKRWIHDELQSYSPRLQVSYQDFSVQKGARWRAPGRRCNPSQPGRAMDRASPWCRRR